MALVAALVIALAGTGATAKPNVAPPKGHYTFSLTDEPGNWFKGSDTGTPVKVVDIGDRVQFDRGTLTGTEHTVTLLIRPTASNLEVDQDHPGNGKVNATFDVPGVFLFVCKVHPYMAGIVAVKDAAGNIPDVTKEQLPFIGHLGLDSLPAQTVIDVLANIAPTDADKAAKWNIISPADEFRPAPGVGEVWVDTQFERVPGQVDNQGVPKPGSITVVDAATFTVEREINGLDPDARGLWNNPHNMWTDVTHGTVYNNNWFGQATNKIDRATGDILDTLVVGQAPTHIVTIPNEASAQFGVLTIPLSADTDMVKVQNGDRLKTIDHFPTGAGRNNPHGHWITANGSRIVVPNVFQGLGVAGSISIIDAENGEVLREFSHSPLGLNSALLLPIAAGIKKNEKAYVANAASGQVSVIDLTTQQLVKSIPVTFTPDGQLGFGILDTLQVPIQPPVRPDGRYVGVAVLSLTTVAGARPAGASTFAPDHVAIIDTETDTVVKFVPIVPANANRASGTHGANWGAKLGGGYYLHVTNQFGNALTIIEVDPNNDGDHADTGVVGQIRLANGSAGAGVTDGTGGQGVKPLPNVYDGWIQDTVALSGTGRLSAEVQGWIDALTPSQKDPDP